MKPMKKKKSQNNYDTILVRVKYLAELEDRSLSSYINLVLREHLKELEKKKG